jgi:hypothetical protein
MNWRLEGFRPVFLLLAYGLLMGGEVDAGAAESPVLQSESRVMIGEFTRAEIEETIPDWVGATVDASPDAGVSSALADVPPGATITVFFGSWCDDSRREMARLWKALDLVAGDVSFDIEYVGTDREMRQPEEHLAGREVLFVPTFIVERNRIEVGRVVEQPVVDIETDLLTLLDGRASGRLSARKDLPPSMQSGSN